MLWEPNIVLVVERHVVHVFMCWVEGGGHSALSSVIKLKYLQMFATEVMKCSHPPVSVGP